MDVNIEKLTNDVVIETIEVEGEFIMEQRHRQERRQRQLNHCSRYERRSTNRRHTRYNKVDITI